MFHFTEGREYSLVKIGLKKAEERLKIPKEIIRSNPVKNQASNFF